MNAAVLARTTRGGVLEAVHRGHVVVLGRDEQVIASAGDPDAVTTARSTVKPIQAIPFAATAHEQLGLGEDELAIACSSHNGEPVHLQAARRILDAAGTDEQALTCAPHMPYDPASADELIRAGRKPSRLHNNCSGKHAGMLAACRVNGWPLDGYARCDHPMQRAVLDAWREHTGVDLGDAPHGVDGCGLPAPGLPLRQLALAMLRGAQRSPMFQRCLAAMAARPHLIGGSGRFDTLVLQAAGDTVVVKGGGAAVWVAVARDGSAALAVKFESGASEAMGPVALTWLRHGGLLATLPPELEPLTVLPLRNWAGDEVGETRAEAPS